MVVLSFILHITSDGIGNRNGDLLPGGCFIQSPVQIIRGDPLRILGLVHAPFGINKFLSLLKRKKRGPQHPFYHMIKLVLRIGFLAAGMSAVKTDTPVSIAVS